MINSGLVFKLILIVGIAIETLVLSIALHLLYRAFTGWSRYEGIRFPESAIIMLATVPGIATCGRGWMVIGIPMPLIIGAPLDMLISSNECKWKQCLIFDTLDRTIQYISMPATWLIVCGLFLFVLFKNKNKPNK